jgi:hypothetical protein
MHEANLRHHNSVNYVQERPMTGCIVPISIGIIIAIAAITAWVMQGAIIPRPQAAQARARTYGGKHLDQATVP